MLGASLIQALRAAALLLIPFWLIALIAWATAGSISGSTSDPIRAATWIWLGGHHVPFSLVTETGAGLLSYLPIGALVLPFFVLRSGLERTIDNLQGQYTTLSAVRLMYSGLYALIATLLALISKSPEVTPIWYIALPTTFLLALLASFTAGSRLRITAAMGYAFRLLAIALGISTLAFATSLSLNFAQAKNITTVLQPGYFGGLLHIFLNVLYIPNGVIATLAYFAGAGFAIGKGTLIAPFIHRIGEVPAIPFIAATPNSKELWALVGVLVFISLGVQLVLWANNLRTIVQSFFIIIVSMVLLSYLGSGALLTDAMGAIGVSIWKTTLLVAGEIGLGIVGAITIPRFLSRRS